MSLTAPYNPKSASIAMGAIFWGLPVIHGGLGSKKGTALCLSGFGPFGREDVHRKQAAAQALVCFCTVQIRKAYRQAKNRHHGSLAMPKQIAADRRHTNVIEAIGVCTAYISRSACESKHGITENEEGIRASPPVSAAESMLTP
jgi:hypothetical protein